MTTIGTKGHKPAATGHPVWAYTCSDCGAMSRDQESYATFEPCLGKINPNKASYPRLAYPDGITGTEIMQLERLDNILDNVNTLPVSDEIKGRLRQIKAIWDNEIGDSTEVWPRPEIADFAALMERNRQTLEARLLVGDHRHDDDLLEGFGGAAHGMTKALRRSDGIGYVRNVAATVANLALEIALRYEQRHT